MKNDTERKTIRKKANAGFTLAEVLIALTVFALFITAYMTSQGQNLADSDKIRRDLFLKQLTAQALNEAILNPPDYTEGLTMAPVTKSFEDYPDYDYTIEYRRVKIPDITQMMSSQNEESDMTSSIDEMTLAIARRVQLNLEELIWQIQVTVVDKNTKENFTLSTWSYNDKAKLQGMNVL